MQDNLPIGYSTYDHEYLREKKTTHFLQICALIGTDLSIFIVQEMQPAYFKLLI